MPPSLPQAGTDCYPCGFQTAHYRNTRGKWKSVYRDCSDHGREKRRLKTEPRALHHFWAIDPQGDEAYRIFKHPKSLPPPRQREPHLGDNLRPPMMRKYLRKLLLDPDEFMHLLEDC
jgi:hypothetical protein